MAMLLSSSVKKTARGFVRAMCGGYGDGVGKGGGGGGTIRDAGGAFGKMEAAREDEYFYKKQKQQLEELKAHLQKEIKHYEQQLESHQEVLKRHRERVKEIEETQKKHE